MNSQWSARDAWKCLGMFVVFEVTLGFFKVFLGSALPSFHVWKLTGEGHFSISLSYSIIYLCTAAYFARTESWRSFFTAVGLTRRPSYYIWFGLVVTIVLRFLTHLAIQHGIGTGSSTTSVIGFRRSIGLERYLFLAPTLLAAPFEETYMRGFVYKAFRASYSREISTVIVLAVTALAHLSQYRVSWIAVFSLSALTILQCYLREKSDSLWDCIVCHFVWNFMGAFDYLIFHPA